ncbi:rubrerythrin family protein [Candidatus Bathyarchaeota archaeon]|nr:rubrerythrin family protein [Candidatus Bathyarchaeota archaeon]
MSETIEKLLEAFAGESQANRKYLAFAKKADEEGIPQAAKLFRAAAEAETIHALNHLRIAGKIGTTLSNLDEAINGETYEFKTMYPEFIVIAEKEKNRAAEWSFNIANKVEEVHANLYKKLLTGLQANQVLPEIEYYVCKVCGNTVENSTPKKCAICGAPQTQFIKIE